MPAALPGLPCLSPDSSLTTGRPAAPQGGDFASLVFPGDVSYGQAFAQLSDDTFVASSDPAPRNYSLVATPPGSLAFFTGGRAAGQDVCRREGRGKGREGRGGKEGGRLGCVALEAGKAHADSLCGSSRHWQTASL